MTVPKELARIKRHWKIRKKLAGTSERPRLAVHRSLNHLYVQVVDDTQAKTLFSFSTLDKTFSRSAGKLKKSEVAAKLGEFFAGPLLKKGIRKVAFDRGGYAYHGRIKALADSLRKGGLEF